VADDDSDVEFDDTEVEEAEADTDDVEEQPDAPAEPAKPGPKKEPAAAKEDPEILRLRAALKKANDDGKKNRLTLKELEERGRANEGDHERALREAREEAESRWKPRIVNQAARAALAEAGFVGVDRILPLLDLAAMDVDDDGDVIGLLGEIDRVKEKYPEFLAKPEAERPRPKARPTGAPKPAAPEKPRNSWEKHAANVFGAN
jgi:hypothetical protein